MFVGKSPWPSSRVHYSGYCELVGSLHPGLLLRSVRIEYPTNNRPPSMMMAFAQTRRVRPQSIKTGDGVLETLSSSLLQFSTSSPELFSFRHAVWPVEDFWKLGVAFYEEEKHSTSHELQVLRNIVRTCYLNTEGFCYPMDGLPETSGR